MAILASVDGEAVPDNVVSVGLDLANAYGEELVVLHVMPRERFEERRENTTPDSKGTVLAPEADYGFGRETESGTNDSSGENVPTIDKDGEPDAASVARDVVRETINEYEDVSFQGRVGDPSQEILEEAERRDVRHIVVGGQNRSPVGKAVFGSVTQSVLLNAERPVTKVLRSK